MLGTLRNRLILSHVLPLLIVVPLLGVWLIYSLERQFIVPAMAAELKQDARMVAGMSRHHPEVWQEPAAAQALLGSPMNAPGKRVMLVAPDGRILASNDTADSARINGKLSAAEWEPAGTGEAMPTSRDDPYLGVQIIDVFYPVADASGDGLGFVRVSHRYATLGTDLLRMRDVVATTIVVALLGGTALGLVLALSISGPLQRVTGAVYDLASGKQSKSLPEEGPVEIRVLLQAVNHLVERLRDLEAARQQLLANLVHELGRPLGALRLALQALQRGAFEDPKLGDDLLEGMDGEMARLEVLVEDLSHLHDQVLGVLELDYQALNLDEWLPRVLQPWQLAAEKQDLDWNLTIETQEQPLMADPVRLAQAIGNLVANAIKYTVSGGAVAVVAGQNAESGWTWIRVGDTGSGISHEEQEKVFEPFFRGGAQKRIKQGLGLGLSIARELVLAHGGSLTLESEPGVGSTFTIWLPPGRSDGQEQGQTSP